MPNYKQAPKLYHNKSNYNSKNYYNLPQKLMDCVFNQLDGKCGNQIKLISVLLGTLGDGSFGVSEKWICERTGIGSQQAYSAARKALIERGWIYLENGNIYVLPTIIECGIPYTEDELKGDKESEEKRKKKFNDTVSNCVNNIKKRYNLETKAQCENVKQAQCENVEQAQCENVYNKINNKNNGDTSKQEQAFVPSGQNPIPTRNFQVEKEITLNDFNAMQPQGTWIDEEIFFISTTGKYIKVIKG